MYCLAQEIPLIHVLLVNLLKKFPTMPFHPKMVEKQRQTYIFSDLRYILSLIKTGISLRSKDMW
jgi:hypothetical protein